SRASVPFLRCCRGWTTTHAGHCDYRTNVEKNATAAQRIHGTADVLPPRHQIEIDHPPPLTIRRGIECALVLLGRSGSDPTQTIGDPMHVRIDANVAGTT